MSDDWIVHESIAPTKWCLEGSITTPAYLLRTGNVLKIVRPFGTLSSGIWSAMSSKATLPKVEIQTPGAKVTLVNAKIVKIGPFHPPATSSHAQSADTYEQEEISFTFQKIDVSGGQGISGANDDWNVTTGKKKKK